MKIATGFARSASLVLLDPGPNCGVSPDMCRSRFRAGLWPMRRRHENVTQLSRALAAGLRGQRTLPKQKTKVSRRPRVFGCEGGCSRTVTLAAGGKKRKKERQT